MENALNTLSYYSFVRELVFFGLFYRAEFWMQSRARINALLIFLKVACAKTTFKPVSNRTGNYSKLSRSVSLLSFSVLRLKVEDRWIRPNAAKRSAKSEIDTLRCESGEKCGCGIFDIPIVAAEWQRTGKQIVWLKINRHLIYSHARSLRAEASVSEFIRIYGSTRAMEAAGTESFVFLFCNVVCTRIRVSTWILMISKYYTESIILENQVDCTNANR